MMVASFCMQPNHLPSRDFSHLPALCVLGEKLKMRFVYIEPFHSTVDILEWLSDTRRTPTNLSTDVFRLEVSAQLDRLAPRKCESDDYVATYIVSDQ